jgi:hypothetical protein
MKKIVVFVLLLIAVLSVNAQTWDEWFRQRKTQRRYLLKQIAALKVYIDYAQKGYDIASKGLATIRNIKNGDFNLHKDFLGSLKLVNPAVKKYGKVADIIGFQVRIIKGTKQTIQHIRESGQFTPEELNYCTKVFDNLLDECFKSIDELFLVITSGELEMKDDERIKRIDMLYTDMQHKHAFSEDFGNGMGMLAMQRANEQVEINYSKILNGLQP